MWQMTNAWDVMTAVFTAIGVIAAFHELQEVRKARRIEALNTFLGIWGSIEEREARRFVFREFDFNGLNSLADEQRKKIEMVLTNCNRISYLVLNRLVPEEDVLRLIGRPIIRVWDCLEPFIRGRREEVGQKLDTEDPYRYMVHLEWFVRKYRNKLEPKSS